MKVEKPVVHISLNPHPEDVLTDTELQDIAREYLEKLGFGTSLILFQARGHRPPPPAHRDGQVDENGKGSTGFPLSAAATDPQGTGTEVRAAPAERKNHGLEIRCARWTHRQVM